jgi:hypothetical protein
MKHLCNLNQKDLKNVIYDYLTNKYDNIVHTKDYLFAEGTIPICLVAHLDTVFKQLPKEIYYDADKKVMWSPQGLGADDRAGVYAILELLNLGYRPSIIFTTDEEIGGLGATKLITQYSSCPFSNIKAIIELDRQGKDDCVFYECDNPDFENYICQFGFITEVGSFSDISIIAPQWGIAAVNLSVGYIDEHSYNERLFEEYLDKTILKVKNILDEAETMLNYEYIPLTLKNNNCSICQTPLIINSFEVMNFQGLHLPICRNCYENCYCQTNNRKRKKNRKKL